MLVRESAKTTRAMSRHDRVCISTPGLVTVAGGKLTTYRPMARRTLQAVARARGRNLPATETTHRISLPGSPGEELGAFQARVRSALCEYAVPDPALRRIEFLYGTEAEILLRYGSERGGWLETLGKEVSALRGEVRLAIEYGMARTLADVMDRRMALLLFADRGGIKGVQEAASIAGKLLGWSSSRREQEIRSYADLVRQHGRLGQDSATVPVF